MEARNLAPDIAELFGSNSMRAGDNPVGAGGSPVQAGANPARAGGNPVRALSSGEAENLARFEVVGRKNGSFLISIRLVPWLGRPLP
jgi:hypothetical protein